MKKIKPFIWLKRAVIKYYPLGPKLWVYFLTTGLFFGLLPLLFVGFGWFSTFFLVWMLIYFLTMYFISYLVIEQVSLIAWRQMHKDLLRRYKELDTILYNFYYFKLFIWLMVIRALKAGWFDIWVVVCIVFIIINLFSLCIYLFRERSVTHYWSLNLWDYRSKK